MIRNAVIIADPSFRINQDALATNDVRMQNQSLL